MTSSPGAGSEEGRQCGNVKKDFASKRNLKTALVNYLSVASGSLRGPGCYFERSDLSWHLWRLFGTQS